MRSLFISILAILSLSMGSCASVSRLNAVPQDQQQQAGIPGLENIRYRIGTPEAAQAIQDEAVTSTKRELDYRAAKGLTGKLPPANFLAISGGGDNGAFAAGLLNGWTVSGTRPEFKLVTGISTGAIIAPFAFLGPQYDDRLKDFYTQTAPRDILIPRSILTAFFSDAMSDNSPLWKKVEKEITPALLDNIAKEYEKGRLLLVGTTDLDARQGIIWNMTKIAASKHPRALELFRSIIVASAAIPAGFPPVMIDVVADNKKYEEMHVDGGATAQIFAYPQTLRIDDLSDQYQINRERNLYLIRNSRLDPDWSNTERRITSIAGRAISSLIHSQGLGDLYRIYLTAQRDRVSYNLAYIPTAFSHEHKEEFDTAYMRALYQVGYDMAKDQYPWQHTPPGFEEIR